MTEHIELAAQAVTKAGLISEVEPHELVEIMQHAEIQEKDIDKLAGIVVYVRKRFLEKQSRYASFKVAFRDRCIPQENSDKNVPFPNTTGEVSRTAIEIKAKRLEQSVLYKKVVGLLQTSLYISYAMDRMVVLDKLLGRIKDDSLNGRDLASVSKVFLDATAKPESTKEFEVNMNFGDDSSLKSIEDKLGDISARLHGKSAEEIIDVLALPSGDR